MARKPTAREQAVQGQRLRHEQLKYLVVEFDLHEPPEWQAAQLSSLHSPACPLCLAVWSGGKSIHGWFNAAGLSPYEKKLFFLFAAYLAPTGRSGTTPRCYRMPGGVRRTGRRQAILYLRRNTFERRVRDTFAGWMIPTAAVGRGEPAAPKPYSVIALVGSHDLTLPPRECFLGSVYAGPAQALVAQGGLGKSRLSLCLARHQVLRQDFAGFPVGSRPYRWLFIGNENSTHRLLEDVKRMTKGLSAAELAC
jgi:hypothetical protein